jgi:CelD/BcsL family acetyltransferase involved in cellulose biosynthesis
MTPESLNRAPVGHDAGAAEPAPTVPAAAAGLSVEVQHDVALAPADARVLDSLIVARPEAGVFVSTAWLSGLFDEPPDDCEPVLVLLRQTGSLRAIAPIAIRQTLMRAHVGLLGGGLGSGRIDLVAARGFEVRAADTFLGWLRATFGRRGLILELRDVPADSPLWGAIQRAGLERRQTLVLQPRRVHTLPYLDLVEHRPSIFPDVNGSRLLRSLNRHRRWLEHRGRLTIERIEEADDAMKAFEELRRFLHGGWCNQAVGSMLDHPRVLRFHQRALRLLLKDGRLRMIRLRVDARTAGVFYGLASGRWWGCYLAGCDREWSGRFHLGQITLATAIDLASQECAGEFEFLKGADRVTHLLPVRERSTLDADLYSARPGALLKRATHASLDAAVALARSLRELVSSHGSPPARDPGESVR